MADNRKLSIKERMIGNLYTKFSTITNDEENKIRREQALNALLVQANIFSEFVDVIEAVVKNLESDKCDLMSPRERIEKVAFIRRKLKEAELKKEARDSKVIDHKKSEVIAPEKSDVIAPEKSEAVTPARTSFEREISAIDNILQSKNNNFTDAQLKFLEKAKESLKKADINELKRLFDHHMEQQKAEHMIAAPGIYYTLAGLVYPDEVNQLNSKLFNACAKQDLIGNQLNKLLPGEFIVVDDGKTLVDLNQFFEVALIRMRNNEQPYFIYSDHEEKKRPVSMSENTEVFTKLKNYFPFFKQLYELSEDVIQEYEGSLFEILTSLREALLKADVNHGGSELNAGSDANIGLVAFKEKYDRIPKRIRDEIEKLEGPRSSTESNPKTFGFILNNLFKKPENASSNAIWYCIQLLGRELDALISKNADTLQKSGSLENAKNVYVSKIKPLLENPLQLAIFNHDIERVRYIIQQNPNLMHKEYNGQSVLDYAIQSNNADALQLLLSHGFKAETKHISAVMANGDGASCMKVLIESNPALLETKDQFGNTPLIQATEQKREAIIAYLVSTGANISATFNNPNHAFFKTAFVDAAYEIIVNNSKKTVNYELLKTCLKAGIHHNVKHFYEAIQRLDAKLLEVLVEHDKSLLDTCDEYGQTPIVHAFKYARGSSHVEYKEVLKFFIKCRVNLDVTYKNPSYNEYVVNKRLSDLILNSAIHFDDPEMVKMILDAGIKPTVNDLENAFNKKNSKIVKYLIEQNVTLLTQGKLESILNNAFTIWSPELLTYLLSIKGKTVLDDGTVFSNRVLDLAVEKKSHELVAVALKEGAAPTLSHVINAIRRRDLPTLRLLIEKDKSYIRSNVQPLAVASNEKFPEIVHYLIEAGANLDLKIKEGTRRDTKISDELFMDAVLNNDIKTVSLLLNRDLLRHSLHLSYAISHANLEIANLMIKHHPLDETTANTTLLRLIDPWKGEKVYYLLDQSIRSNISIPDKTMEMILENAIRNHEVKLIQRIFTSDAIHNLRPERISRAIEELCKFSDLETFNELLNRNQALFSKEWPKHSQVNQSFFHKVVEEGRENIVAFLLKHIQPHIINESYKGETPLITAAKCGYEKTVELLLKASANPSYKSSLGSPLSIAAQIGNIKIIEQLLAHNAPVDEQSLTLAIEHKHDDIARLLLATNTDPNQPYASWTKSPLYLAADNNNASLVQDLLKAGADPNKLFGHMTPFLRAIINNSNEIAMIFLKTEKIDVNLQNPLMYASLLGNCALMKELLARNADPNSSLIDKPSPLFAAVFNGNLDAVKLLTQSGYTVDVQQTVSKTTSFLELARMRGKQSQAEAWIRKSKGLASTNITLRAFDLANILGYKEIASEIRRVEVLLEINNYIKELQQDIKNSNEGRFSINMLSDKSAVITKSKKLDTFNIIAGLMRVDNYQAKIKKMLINEGENHWKTITAGIAFNRTVTLLKLIGVYDDVERTFRENRNNNDNKQINLA